MLFVLEKMYFPIYFNLLYFILAELID